MLTKYLWLLREVTKVLVQAQRPSFYMSLDKWYHFLGHGLPICEMRERLRSKSHKLKHMQDPGRWAERVKQAKHIIFYVEYLCTSICFLIAVVFTMNISDLEEI